MHTVRVLRVWPHSSPRSFRTASGDQREVARVRERGSKPLQSVHIWRCHTDLIWMSIQKPFAFGSKVPSSVRLRDPTEPTRSDGYKLGCTLYETGCSERRHGSTAANVSRARPGNR